MDSAWPKIFQISAAVHSPYYSDDFIVLRLSVMYDKM